MMLCGLSMCGLIMCPERNKLEVAVDDGDSRALASVSSAHLTLWAPRGGGAAALTHR